MNHDSNLLSNKKTTFFFVYAVILCVILIALAISFYRLSVIILYQVQMPAVSDGAIYYAMGRGIVNGLTPYIDLFETKPPGIFFAQCIVHHDIQQ